MQTRAHHSAGKYIAIVQHSAVHAAGVRPTWALEFPTALQAPIAWTPPTAQGPGPWGGPCDMKSTQECIYAHVRNGNCCPPPQRGHRQSGARTPNVYPVKTLLLTITPECPRAPTNGHTPQPPRTQLQCGAVNARHTNAAAEAEAAVAATASPPRGPFPSPHFFSSRARGRRSGFSHGLACSAVNSHRPERRLFSTLVMSVVLC